MIVFFSWDRHEWVKIFSNQINTQSTSYFPKYHSDLMTLRRGNQSMNTLMNSHRSFLRPINNTHFNNRPTVAAWSIFHCCSWLISCYLSSDSRPTKKTNDPLPSQPCQWKTSVWVAELGSWPIHSFTETGRTCLSLSVSLNDQWESVRAVHTGLSPEGSNRYTARRCTYECTRFPNI